MACIPLKFQRQIEELNTKRKKIMTKSELRAWALSILIQAQEKKEYGVISVHVEGGKITRVETKKTELPPRLDKA